jgi:protein-tyrosine phosphatase
MKNAGTVLFLCTGNYYRSRLAEYYFNALAASRNLAWQATSRGLRINPGNPGPISVDALVWLAERGIAVPEPVRYPISVTDNDLQSATAIVAVKEAEHRPLLESHFPCRIDRVEFWHIHDLDVETPDEALPQLAAKVEAMVTRLSARNVCEK